MPTARDTLACNRIQAKIRTLAPTYIQNAPDMDSYFTSLHDAQCPYIMTWPGEGTIYQKGGGYKGQDRTFIVFGFIESLAQKDIPTRALQATEVMDAIENLFVIAANIPLADINADSYQIMVESDENTRHGSSGLTARLPFSGVPWFGFTLRLNVRTQWII